MANDSIILKCTVASQDKAEGVVLKSDYSWKSSPHGHWLPVQKGKWIQASTAGVRLRDDSGNDIAFLKGLIFDTATENQTGIFRFDAGGDAGKWQVTDTLP